MTPIQAAEIIGQKLMPGFTLSDPAMLEAYGKVFESFVEGIGENKKRSKGCGLIGSKGVGKSACMRVMNAMFRDTERLFKYCRAADIIKLLDVYKPSEIKDEFGFGQKSDLYIDDIGLGQAVKNDYGNKINIISEILIERYELFIESGFKTHWSTNKFFNVNREKSPDAPPTIYDMYGDVVCDRLNEMNKIIVWQGQSLRK